MNYQHLKLEKQNGVLSVRINRPEVRNAFNEELIADLAKLFALPAAEDPYFADVRVIVLSGEGPAFCGGGDLRWMKNGLALSQEENLADCQRLTQMFLAMDRCPLPLLGVVHGYAIGGGVGLTAVCDHVIASEETIFSLSEVKLGLIPACIGPFVIGKIGISQSRSLFISGERFDAKKALAIGLVHQVVSKENLDAEVSKVAKRICEGGPVAIEAAKYLIHTLSRDLLREDFSKSLDFAANELAQLRILPEAQEGVRAFLEKRIPEWRLKENN